MISRYQRPEMTALWSLEKQYESWLEVELAVIGTQAELGLVPKEAAAEVSAKAKLDPARILAIEDQVRHDLIAFVTSLEEAVGPAARYLHYGLTSSDVVDTGLALRLVKALDIIASGLGQLLANLKEKAYEFKDVLIIGRSHGIHAEPTTFGLKLAIFYAEFQRHQERLTETRQRLAVGKISGPVGNFSAPGLSLELEEKALNRLGLKAAPVSNQIIQRDRHGEFFCDLALLASSIEKLAVEIRHLARTEIGEVEEPFSKSQKGSSAMPHKKNPILAENISGLARVVRANAQAALENVALWHERDISHSSVERIIAPDSTSLVDFMLHRLAGLIKNMVVHPERMAQNLARTGGLYNSQELLLALCTKGLSRQEAYRLIQREALKAHSQGLDFKTLLSSDPEISALISPEDLADIFSQKRFTQSVDKIFNRVFI